MAALFYPSNADGVRWFMPDVFPRVRSLAPAASMTIIGPRPPRDLALLANGDSIRVTGYVPDLAPYLSGAALMVVPVRAGSGMRVRILEALARGVPVVTTSMGAEG